MRYAVLSDVHANLPAWNVVHTDIQSSGVDEILCLGDVIGYGPDPAEVLERLYTHVHHFVLGNHDAVIAGRLDPACFNAQARALIEWTHGHLDSKAEAFFRDLPHVLSAPTFRCVHSDPAAPTLFRYVLDPSEALAAWDACDEQVIFVGHSHVPGIYVLGHSGTPHWLAPQDFALEQGKRYIVNVGSVGQPRDADVRACYCIYDLDAESIHFRRIPFDVTAYRAALERADIPVKSAAFLRIADALDRCSLREVLDFHPLTAADPGVDELSESRLAGVERAARRWRLGAAVLTVLLALFAAALTYSLRSKPSAGVTFRAKAADGPPFDTPAVGGQWRPDIEAVGSVGPEARLAHWSVTLGSPDQQQVAVEMHRDSAKPEADSYPVFRVRSGNRSALQLAGHPTAAEQGMQFRVSASLKMLVPVTGYLRLCLYQQLPDGSAKPLFEHPVEGLAEGQWRFRAKTSEPLRDTGPVCWGLEGEFEGELLVRRCVLERTR